MNKYATLAEYKAYVTARGQTASTDTTDDAVITNLLEQASRYIDGETGRVFYPFIQDRVYDVPSTRSLYVDEDLLEVLTLTNVDAFTSSDYYLLPRNEYPAHGVILKQMSRLWLVGIDIDVTVSGIWGYHNAYNRGAWYLATTLTEELDTTETEFDVTSSTSFAVGQIVRYGNQIANVITVASGKITVNARNDNGSTAAIVATGSNVYIWRPMAAARHACLEIASFAYNRRFGKESGYDARITAAGVILIPRDIPATARAFINTHKDMK